MFRLRCVSLVVLLGTVIGGGSAMAGEPRGTGAGFAIGAGSLQRYDRPLSARRNVDRARRALSGDLSIKAARQHWQLDEIERDADRALRYMRGSQPVGSRVGLSRDRGNAPDARSLRDGDPIYGAGKLWVRVGGLLSAAESALTAGDLAGATSATRAARALADRSSTLLASGGRADPHVEASLGRLRTIEAWIEASHTRSVVE